jgi:hypothetical protein
MREGEGFFWKERRFQERKAGIEMPNGETGVGGLGATWTLKFARRR